jgi:hypothetical protein
LFLPGLLAAVAARAQSQNVLAPQPVALGSNGGVPTKQRGNTQQTHAQQQETPKKETQGAGTDGSDQIGLSGKPKYKGRRYKFLTPWPEGYSYTCDSGKALTKEFEEYYECRIYTDRMAILTLCSEYRQGFHDVCKN